MALVTNGMVKMEWGKVGFLTRKQGSVTAFYFAAKVYESAKYGRVAVFFDPFMAYVWRDEDTEYDLWSVSELKGYVKENYDAGFPLAYEGNCVPLVNYGSETVDETVLEALGLTEYKEDILARIKDLAPYGVETELSND